MKLQNFYIWLYSKRNQVFLVHVEMLVEKNHQTQLNLKALLKKKSTKYSRNQKVLTYENVCTCLRNEYLGDSYKFLALLTGDASEGSMVLVVRVDNSAVCC